MPESSERGALTEAVFYILLSLYTPLHGYGMMQKVRELSKGRVDLGPGTLYGAISTLLDKHWITAVVGAGEKEAVGTRKKEYLITVLGKNMIAEELLRLEELLQNGREITRGSVR